MRRILRGPKSFFADRRGASAVEFAIISMPFILLLLGILQLGIWFLSQSALDSGVLQAADSIVNTYYSATTPATMTPASLKATIISKTGSLISTANLSVDFRLLSNLGSAAVPIANVVDVNGPGSILALRAQSDVPSFVPGMTTLRVRSSALVRRLTK